MNSLQNARLDAAFFADRSERGRLRVTGRDRQSFLQGMVTNDVAALAPGQGCYAFMLDPTAHVLSDLRVLCRESELLLDVEPGMASFVAETLDKYLIMEKCRIADVTGETAQVFVGGREAPRILTRLGIADSEEWAEGRNEAIQIGDAEALVAATRLIAAPGYDIYLTGPEAKTALESILAAEGATRVDSETLDALRIEAGVPRYGGDISPKVLAPETAQQVRALSYRKGCYIGQEIVARIDARGHTNRTFAGFILEGRDVPTNDAAVTVDGKDVGWVTSAAVSPTLGRPVALGYLRHEYSEPGTPVMVAGRAALVAALPFAAR